MLRHGREELAADARYAGATARLGHREELDAMVAQWTATLDAHQAQELLQGHGVPAHQVQNSVELFADPQLRHRGHFVRLDHQTLGHFTVEAPRPRLGRTPGEVRRAAPSIGQDNAYVLQTILGYGEDRISELALAGVFG